MFHQRMKTIKMFQKVSSNVSKSCLRISRTVRHFQVQVEHLTMINVEHQVCPYTLVSEREVWYGPCPSLRADGPDPLKFSAVTGTNLKMEHSVIMFQ